MCGPFPPPGRSDNVKFRLSEVGESRMLENPGTPYVDLQARLRKPRATLPYGLFAPLMKILKPYMRMTDPTVHAPTMSFSARGFEETVSDR